MFTSLRARLLVWYSLLLAAIVAAFAALVLFGVWQARVGDIDRDLQRRTDTLVESLEPSEAGTFDLTLPSPETTEAPDYHAVWDDRGHLIDQDDAPDTSVPASEGFAFTIRGREQVSRTPAGAVVLVGRDLSDVRQELWSLAGTMGAIAAGALLLALVGGWWLTGRALAPVEAISQTAQLMSGGDFAARIPLDRVETEVEQLARALNEAFDRLYDSLQRQQRFAADASHELRTPLATLTTEVNWALRRPRTPDEYQASLRSSQRAAARMQRCVEQLLQLARADAPGDPTPAEPCSMDALAAEVACGLEPLARNRDVQLHVEAAPVRVWADPGRLGEALNNLVANAIHYNVDHGQVWIRVRALPDAAEVEVRDTGVGIAADHLPQLFDRFYRVDAARTAGPGGAGLGLAVARAIVERLGGTLSVISTPGEGSAFTMTIPLGTAPATPPPGTQDAVPGAS